MDQPQAVSWLLIVLLIANLVQTVGTALALPARLALIGFIAVYTAIYVASALCIYDWRSVGH